MVKIQFPKSETNPYWDGEEHDLEPKNLACINDSDYYYLDGFDESFKCNMMTLLRKNGEEFKKVPLDDYDEFTHMLYASNLRLVPTMLVGTKIGLDPEMSTKDLEAELGIGKKPGAR